MTHPAPRYGVKYPSGTWSGPITDSHRDAARYARLYHATVYEVGTAEDPCPPHRPEAAPWFGPEYYTQAAGRIERIAVSPDAPPRDFDPCAPMFPVEEIRYASAEDRYRPDDPEPDTYGSAEDIAAGKADIENDTRKCYPEFRLSSKFGG